MKAKAQYLPADAIDWRARIEANLKRATGKRMRSLFNEINPQLIGEKLFESRWSDKTLDAAILMPIIPRPSGATLLMTVRSPDMPSHAGQISFPGGKAHPEDKTRIDTALREAYEEVNIPPDAVDVIGALGVHQGGLGFSVTPVIGIVDPDTDFRPCPREVDEIFETPLSYIADLNNHIIEQREHQGVKYNMFAVPFEGYHIWGLTAGILRTLAEALQEDETAA